MAYSTYCINKGCGKLQEPYLDPKDDKIYCSACNLELTNVTYFVKAQMKASKQFKPKKQVPFAVKCNVCGKEDKPKIVNKSIVCSSCNDPLNHLSDIFKNMLMEHLKKTDKDV